MRIIGTKTHGYIDYVMSFFLIASPWILGFNRGGAETWIPVVLGVGMMMYSLMTDYELGASKALSMRTHLTLDFLAGAFLAISPWLFQFNDYITTPHLVLGLLEMGASLMTKSHPISESREHSGRHHTVAHS